MGRHPDPDSPNRIKTHVFQGYTYASTQPAYYDPATGKKKYRHIHWGKVDNDLKFIPGLKFYLAPTEVREQLIFPKEWDMSEAHKLTGMRNPGRPVCNGDCRNSLYGDIWLLEQVASITGIRRDLEVVFNGNNEFVDDIITLAMFPYISKFTYNRVAKWQEIVKCPSSHDLTPSVITRLTQSITEQHRIELLKCRAARLGKDELCAADSTSRSAYGDSLADIKFGKNKEQLPLKQTVEVVVYSLSNHMPVYYRTFPGNMPDTRSLSVILKDLEHAGFKSIIMITDRGYDSLSNLEKYILRGLPMVMCVKTGQNIVFNTIESIGEFCDYPKDFQIDSETHIFFKQYDIDMAVKSIGQTTKMSDRMKLNIYFNGERRANDIAVLASDMSIQNEELSDLLASKCILGDDTTIQRDYNYYEVSYDPDTREIKSFHIDEKKYAKKRTLSGFYAIMTHGVDFDAKTANQIYNLRDEQEKYFQQMKDQMVADRQRNWSESGKTGRLFILFVGLILGSYVRHIWKNTKLHDQFSSSLDILDTMRPIRMIEHTNRAQLITPFVGAQVDICEAFGIEVPKGCAPTYKSSTKAKRKRGRPSKNAGTKNF